MPTFDSLVNKKLRNLEKIPDALVSTFDKKQKAVLTEIIEEMSSLKTVDGFIEVSEANLVKINKIISGAKKVFFDKEYNSALKSFAEGFDSQAKLTRELIRAGIGPVPRSELFGELLKASQEQALDFFSETFLDEAYFKPLSSQLLMNIQTGASLQETIKSVKLITTGSSQVDGLLQQHAKTYARTSFAQADAVYTTTISRQMGVEWYKYAGSAIETTRPFCNTRHNKYYHVSEVESWGDLEPWSGQIKGTNSRNIFANRGGWNCRHSIVPYSVFGIPKATVQAAVNKGIYKPTKAVQDWLNK